METNAELGCGRSFGGDVLHFSSHDAQAPNRSDVGGNPQAKTNRQGYQNLQDIDDLDQGGNGATAGGCGAGSIHGDENELKEGTADFVDEKTSCRLAIFGLLNFSYVVLQLVGGMAFGSLALLSDGFHNLSDVAAIGMAIYIHKLQRRRCLENQEGGSDELPYGYKRAEVIGGMINSVALISLSAYIILHAFPRLFYPLEVDSGWSFILLGLGGVFVNLVGVLFFLAAGEDGNSNCHHGGGLLHAHSHSHDHGHEEKYRPDNLTGRLKLRDPHDSMPDTCSTPDEVDEEVSLEFAIIREGSTGREAFLSGVGGMEAGFSEEGSWADIDGGKDRSRLHNHGHLGANGLPHLTANGISRVANGHSGSKLANGHSYLTANGHAAKDDGIEMLGRLSTATERCGATVASSAEERSGNDHESHGHALGNSGGCSHDHGHSRDHGYSHDHGHPTDHGHSHDHAHSNNHGDSDDHGDSNDHGHSHDHGHGVGGGCSGGHGRPGKSMNLWAVLVHAISDAVSSGFVCAQGTVIFFLGYPDRLDWTDYLDPIVSILLSLFIVYCALPVVVECSHILLEGTPRGVDLPSLRNDIKEVRGVTSIRRLSVIKLNSEEPFVGSVTLMVEGTEEGGLPHSKVVDGVHKGGRAAKPLPAAIIGSVKRILAKYNVGQSTVEIEMGMAARFSKKKDPSEVTSQKLVIHHSERSFNFARSVVETSGDAREKRESRQKEEHSHEAGERARDHGGHLHDHGHCGGHGHSHEHHMEEQDEFVGRS